MIIIIIKRLLIKFGLIKIKSAVEIHEQKLSQICRELAQVRGTLNLLLPDELKREFLKYSYISGGCIYSLYNDERPKDFDFFLVSNKLANKLRDYFMGQAGYHGNGISGGMYKNHPLTITDNAISIGKYQIITKWIGIPEEVVNEFDFAHNQFYYKVGLIHTLSDFADLKSKELKYNDKRARDIAGTIIRTSKFIKRGMNITSKEMAKMLLKLHEVGFNERELEILNNAKSDKHFGS